jgi:hydrolase family protein
MTDTVSTRTETVPATGCCPPFDPASWQDKEVTWLDKPFVRDHVACLFHVPLNMGRKVLKDMARIQAVGAGTAQQPLMLSDARSPWGAEIFIEVQDAVPGATMDHLSGTFLTKVFEGPFRQAKEWARQMQDHVAAKGRTLEKLYFGYTTCPRCAKAYGKNYVVLFAKVTAPAAASKMAG